MSARIEFMTRMQRGSAVASRSHFQRSECAV